MNPFQKIVREEIINSLGKIGIYYAENVLLHQIYSPGFIFETIPRSYLSTKIKDGDVHILEVSHLTDFNKVCSSIIKGGGGYFTVPDTEPLVLYNRDYCVTAHLSTQHPKIVLSWGILKEFLELHPSYSLHVVNNGIASTYSLSQSLIKLTRLPVSDGLYVEETRTQFKGAIHLLRVVDNPRLSLFRPLKPEKSPMETRLDKNSGKVIRIWGEI